MISIAQTNPALEDLSLKSQKFFERCHIGNFLRAANACKLKGFPVTQLFIVAFNLVFFQQSFYMFTNTHKGSVHFAKDTFYRFLNSCHTNWNKFTLLLSSHIIRTIIAPLTGKDRVNVLVIDDTMYHRSRSQKVELLARVYDHANKVFSFGFRMLTLGWTDGNTFLPVSHVLLSTENEKNRISEASDKIDPRSNGGKQRKLSTRKGTEVMLELLKGAKAADIPADYVLFDTWFCSPASLIAVKEIGYNTISMAKKSKKVYYRYNGKMQDVKSIYAQNRKRRGRSKYLLSVEAEAVRDERSTPVRLVFVRNKKNKKEWLVLVTTDTGLPEEEVIRLYGKRWSIEVFFKTCKSYLRLEKDCRAVSYDAMTAHVAVVFTRYMYLAVEQRESVDDRSLGELFYMSIDELPDIKFVESFAKILMLFVRMVHEETGTPENELQGMVTTFVSQLPDILAKSLHGCV